jgi:hypothetical protein
MRKGSSVAACVAGLLFGAEAHDFGGKDVGGYSSTGGERSSDAASDFRIRNCATSSEAVYSMGGVLCGSGSSCQTVRLTAESEGHTDGPPC